MLPKNPTPGTSLSILLSTLTSGSKKLVAESIPFQNVSDLITLLAARDIFDSIKKSKFIFSTSCRLQLASTSSMHSNNQRIFSFIRTKSMEWKHRQSHLLIHVFNYISVLSDHSRLEYISILSDQGDLLQLCSGARPSFDPSKRAGAESLARIRMLM